MSNKVKIWIWVVLWVAIFFNAGLFLDSQFFDLKQKETWAAMIMNFICCFFIAALGVSYWQD